MFVGSGVSGGEEGARYGPSLMPGGHRDAWPHIQPIFQVEPQTTHFRALWFDVGTDWLQLLGLCLDSMVGSCWFRLGLGVSQVRLRWFGWVSLTQ